jgi:hypothetical protein
MATRFSYTLPILRQLVRGAAQRLQPGGLSSRIPPPTRHTPFVIVTGAGRSGTSAVARVLHESGIRMGADFDEPTKFNSAGYYQERAIYVVNEEMLAEMGMSGYTGSARWPWRSTVLAVAERYRERLAQIARSDTDGWKDPIFSVTLEAWLPFLPARPKIVVCLRSPEAYADSVMHIYGVVDKRTVMRQWANHYIRLLAVIRDYRLEATCVEYNALVERPEETVGRLAAFVGRPLRHELVEPSLRRYTAPVPERYKQLYASVRALAADAPVATDDAASRPPGETDATPSIAAGDYVAQVGRLLERARAAQTEWAARVEMPHPQPDEATRAATAAYSAVLLEAQQELGALVPPAGFEQHYELTQREINLQRIVAECALAAVTHGSDDAGVIKTTAKVWRQYGQPSAVERMETDRKRALDRALEAAKS